jgi:hypothetical protein
MPSCERCWSDAHRADGHHDMLAEYERLVAERDCTPEEQAGTLAEVCGDCERITVHQHAHVCMACGWSPHGSL